MHEFDRVMNKTLDTDIATTWSNMVPKVLKLAKDTEVTGLQQFLETYTYDVVSDGKCMSGSSTTAM